MAGDGQQLAGLDAASARLEASAAIKRLQRIYGYYLDAGNWSAASRLFADHARFQIGGSGVYIGPARIEQYLQQRNGGVAGLRHGQLNEHMQLQPLIRLAADGRSARGRWRELVLQGEYGRSAAWREGPLHVEYVQQQGVWKILSLRAVETFAVPYQGGWGRNASAALATDICAALPPDEPASPSPDFSPAELLEVAAPPVLPAGGPAALQAVAERLHALVDAAAIGNLISAFGYLTDQRLWDEATTLFTADCSAEYGQSGVYRGRAGIRRLFSLLGPQGLPRGEVANRMQLQPVIHVAPDGKRAWARTRSIVQIAAAGAGQVGDAVCESEFARHDGVWKFRTLRTYPTFLSTYDAGFVRGIQPLPQPSRANPPDAPPSAHYAMLGGFLPPFHYPHPVTGAPVRGGAPACAPPLPRAAVAGAAVPAEASALLERRITQLEDLLAIENLQNSYGYFVDQALWRETAELFADQGTLEIGGRGVFVGRERIHTYLRFLGPEGPIRGRLINHVQLQPVITLDADGRHARARVRFMAQGGDARPREELSADSAGVPIEAPSYFGIGTYENAYVKEAGVWKIARLHSFFRMYTFDQQGWAEKALPLTRLEERLPPDRPPTQTYSIYPDTFIPPPHYPHPVTGTTGP